MFLCFGCCCDVFGGGVCVLMFGLGVGFMWFVWYFFLLFGGLVGCGRVFVWGIFFLEKFLLVFDGDGVLFVIFLL